MGLTLQASGETANLLLSAAGLEETAWGRRIVTAEETRGFVSEDRFGAHSWTTCACGTQSPLIARFSEDLWDEGCVNLIQPKGAPKDDLLRRMGLEFYMSVWYDAFADAARTLIAIERRAAELLAEAM